MRENRKLPIFLPVLIHSYTGQEAQQSFIHYLFLKRETEGRGHERLP